jgi:hypothetical protein
MEITGFSLRIGKILSGYIFRARSEAELQNQIALVLTKAGIQFQREVSVTGGRFDILVTEGFLKVVLELKLKASIASVERQAQKYAAIPDIDAVMVVTTSAQLASKVTGTLSDKPFIAIALRTT